MISKMHKSGNMAENRDRPANRLIYYSSQPKGVRNLYLKAARFLADTFALLSA